MKKLGKKLYEVEETIEAYACSCRSCDCGCACGCSGIFMMSNMYTADVKAGIDALNSDNASDSTSNNYSK